MEGKKALSPGPIQHQHRSQAAVFICLKLVEYMGTFRI